MSEKLLCDDCGEEIIEKFFGVIDDGVRCEKCAVAKYKKDHPLTYDLYLYKHGIIDFDVKA